MRPPTVFINGRFLAQRVTGVQRFAAEILRALDDLLVSATDWKQGSVVVLAPKGARPVRLRAIGFHQIGSVSGHAWEQCVLPLATGRSPLLSFGPTGPLAKRAQVVTIHDAAVHAVPAAYGTAFRTWYKVLLPIIVRRSPRVMTVSEFARGELVRYFGADEGKIRVTGEGWQHMDRLASDDRILARNGLRRGRYFLAVSSSTASKNFAVIARALPMLPADVVVAVAGATDPRLFAASGVPVHPGMVPLGYVRDEELRALYENATAFVFPSLYEGFGLPPIEAMALGCPVICSNAASIPEVCGAAPLYFEPSDAAALAALMRQLVSEPGLRESMIGRGRERLSAHSWKSAAATYLALIREWTQGETEIPRAESRGAASSAAESSRALQSWRLCNVVANERSFTAT